MIYTLQTITEQLFLACLPETKMSSHQENPLIAALNEASKILLETDTLMNATAQALHVS